MDLIKSFNLWREVRKAVKNQQNFVGAPSFAAVNPAFYTHYHSEEYSSAYPSIRAISNEYMTVLPFAIDSNGKPLQNNNIVNALFHPNQADSVVSFNEKIAVSTLALPMTYLLVWRDEAGEAKPGGDFGRKGSKIAGFTFLENPSITRRDGRTYYSMGSQEFTDMEVLVLPGGTQPHNLYGGYSPTQAAVRWITLDDYIADFQKGFFENNAIPAGMFKVTATTTKEYEDVVENLKARHRGAGNNNNVTYSHQPIDPTTGKAATAKIEWIPFQQSNKDIDFKSLFEQANNRIDQSYGVSQFIKGVDDAPNYATAQVSEANFAKRAVKPLLTRNYAQITHELNRITGGIGMAITFNYEIPAVADQEKVEAETHQIHMSLITAAATAGYTLGSTVDAFDLPKRLKLLSTTDSKQEIKNDKAEVDEGNEVESAPDPEKIDGVTPLNEGGFINPISITVEGHTKSEMAKDLEEKLEAAIGTNPKVALTDQQKLEAAARKYMKAQVDRAVAEVDEDPSNEVEPNPTETEEAEFVDDMMAVVVPILVAEGVLGYEEGSKLLTAAGHSTDLLTEYTLADTVEDGYRAYLRRVGQSYGNDTAQAIRAILLQANNEGWTGAETKKALRGIMQTDEWRVKRLGDTELNRSQAIGNIEGVKQIQDQTGIEFEKSLAHDGVPECEWCKALEGVWVAVKEPLIPLDGVLVGVDGGILVNDFATNEGYDPHPNGKGYPVYRVVA